MNDSACPLCVSGRENVVLSHPDWRVILADEPLYPGFCRVIWQAHIAEMTDLSGSDRQRLMHVVWQVESAIREVMQPDKVNIASLGNKVPHLHWHLIPRYVNDAHFPLSVWDERVRDPDAAKLLALQEKLPILKAAISSLLA